MVNARPPVLYLHWKSKHEDKDQCTPVQCFPQLADFDPDDPKGEKKAKADAEKKKKAAAKKKKDTGGDLGDLLDAGLSMGKKSKKKFSKK